MVERMNCSECNISFEYIPKEGFPRKYCFPCADKKKASFADKQVIAVDVAVDEDNRLKFVPDKPKKNGFDITPMYVSYAKDIFIAGMEMNKSSPVEDVELMAKCISLVKQAKEGLQ